MRSPFMLLILLCPYREYIIKISTDTMYFSILSYNFQFYSIMIFDFYCKYYAEY